MSEVIKATTQAKADALKADMLLGENGVITIDQAAFEKSLAGTDITMDQVKAVHDHTREIFAASALAVGEMAIEAMTANPELKQVTFDMPVYKDSISHSVLHSKEVRLDVNDPTKTETRYGQFATSRYVAFCAGNRGEVKKVRSHIAALATAALK